jgi:hypothetical protein
MAFRAQAAPIVVEVLAPSLVGLGSLHRLGGSGRREPRPGDVGSGEAFRLLGFLDALQRRFGGRVVVHLIEPFSWAWLVRVLRFRPRVFPLFLIAGRVAVTGLDESAVEGQVSRLLDSPSGPVS